MGVLICNSPLFAVDSNQTAIGHPAVTTGYPFNLPSRYQSQHSHNRHHSTCSSPAAATTTCPATTGSFILPLSMHSWLRALEFAIIFQLRRIDSWFCVGCLFRHSWGFQRYGIISFLASNYNLSFYILLQLMTIVPRPTAAATEGSGGPAAVPTSPPAVAATAAAAPPRPRQEVNLTPTQCLSIQSIFAGANRLTRPDKALILSFMTGQGGK